MKLDSKRIVALEAADDTEFGINHLWLISSEEPVPEYENTAEILIQILFVPGMVHSVRRRSVQYSFHQGDASDGLSMEEKLIEQIEGEEKRHLFRLETEQNQRGED